MRYPANVSPTFSWRGTGPIRARLGRERKSAPARSRAIIAAKHRHASGGPPPGPPGRALTSHPVRHAQRSCVTEIGRSAASGERDPPAWRVLEDHAGPGRIELVLDLALGLDELLDPDHAAEVAPA